MELKNALLDSLPHEIKIKASRITFDITEEEYWKLLVFDKNSNQIYNLDSCNIWTKYFYDENDNYIFMENSDGYWEKKSYNDKNERIYFENSDGKVIVR